MKTPQELVGKFLHDMPCTKIACQLRMRTIKMENPLIWMYNPSFEATSMIDYPLYEKGKVSDLLSLPDVLTRNRGGAAFLTPDLASIRYLRVLPTNWNNPLTTLLFSQLLIQEMSGNYNRGFGGIYYSEAQPRCGYVLKNFWHLPKNCTCDTIKQLISYRRYI